MDLLNWGKRTATVIGLKLEDLPPHLVQTGEAVAPLIVIEGPNEPANMQYVNDLVVEFFLDYVPSQDRTGAMCHHYLMPTWPLRELSCMPSLRLLLSACLQTLVFVHIPACDHKQQLRCTCAQIACSSAGTY